MGHQDLWQPLENVVLVSVPERFVQKYALGTKRLYMPAGSDDWAATTEALKLGFGTATEADEQAHQTRVQTGTVLAISRTLTEDMDLCPGLGTREEPRLEGVFDKDGNRVKHANGRPVFRANGTRMVPRYHTAADIQERVAIGDSVYFERDYLDDEHEVSPGVYRLPYSALICTIKHNDNWVFFPTRLYPLAGYVLLWRVWADDVVPENEGSTLKVRKAGEVIIETNVPPLENEGIVAWVSEPLRGVRSAEAVKIGQRVVIAPDSALYEEICGTSYICVRQPNIIAIITPKPMSKELIKDGSTWIRKSDQSAVKVEDSQPQGNTQFKRVVGLPGKNGKLIRRRITKKTSAFLKEFEKAAH